MTFNIKYDPDSHCVRTDIQGEVNIGDIVEVSKEMVRLASLHDCDKILNDVRRAEPKLSTVDIYNIPKVLQESGLKPTTRSAIVAQDDHTDFQFLETVALNRGQNVKLFTNVDTAKRWLSNTLYVESNLE